MNRSHNNFRMLRSPLALAVAAVIALAATPAMAIDFGEGDFTGSLDTTVSFGASWRAQDQADDLIAKSHFDPAIVAKIAALTAAGDYLAAQELQVAARGRFSANRDDGNLKYDKGDVISNAFKITSELSLNYRDSGAFARATYFYDFENASRDDLTQEARDLVGKRFRLLDAFVFHNFSYGEAGQGTVRLGRQVVSWGESTFIQNGINVINPFDLSALRVAGAELKEAYLPIDSLWASFSITDKLSFEALYMFEFEEIEVDAAGTYFSANDFAAPGGEYVMLNFGTVPQPINNPALYRDVCFNGAAGWAMSDTGMPPSLVAAGCTAAFPRSPNKNAKDSGQFGAALRYYADFMNGVEFGLFYLNYHSRVPLVSGISVTNTSPNSGSYFLEYPEDIELWGLSWSTSLPGGVAFQGEVSYRPNMPLQVDDVELLFAGLTPLNVVIPQPGLRFRSQLGSYGPGEYIRGWERHEISQAQSTFTKVIGPGNFLGAEQISLVGEFGATKVWDLPDASVMRYEGEGTDTGGGYAIDSGYLRNPVTLTTGFATAFSWGYRLAGRADYPNAFGSPFTISPRVAFNHDVNGTTPGPGGNFLEGRKSGTLGVEANYMNRWSFDLSYTVFTGGKPHNQIHDRDFYSVVAKYSF
jgi:hypothetical protein